MIQQLSQRQQACTAEAVFSLNEQVDTVSDSKTNTFGGKKNHQSSETAKTLKQCTQVTFDLQSEQPNEIVATEFIIQEHPTSRNTEKSSNYDLFCDRVRDDEAGFEEGHREDGRQAYQAKYTGGVADIIDEFEKTHVFNQFATHQQDTKSSQPQSRASELEPSHLIEKNAPACGLDADSILDPSLFKTAHHGNPGAQSIDSLHAPASVTSDLTSEQTEKLKHSHQMLAP